MKVLPKRSFLWRALFMLSLLSSAVGQEAGARQPGDVFLTEARLETLRTRIDARFEPTYSAWLELQAECDANLDHQPEPVETLAPPPRYDDPVGNEAATEALRRDSPLAYRLALCYRMTGDEAYAEVSGHILEAWATTLTGFGAAFNDQERLAVSLDFPLMIFAADLLEGAPNWSDEKQDGFKRFIRDTVLPQNAMAEQNNHGNWGLLLVAAAAAYLDDKELFDEAVQRWKFFVHMQIGPEGEMWFEVRRHAGAGERGIGYSHFALQPQTAAAEILRINGEDLYGWVSPNGNTLRKAFDTVAHWARYPERFPYYEGDPADMPWDPHEPTGYFEILNARWPNEDAAAIIRLERPYDGNPPAMTFTHGEPLSE